MEKKFEDIEIWDHIPGYEGLYKVSSKGRVFSLKSQKCMTPALDNSGYYLVSLRTSTTKKMYRLHRLVATTFYFAEDYNGLQVDHVDRDKTNNNLLNLRFCTNSENQRNQKKSIANKSGYKGVSWRNNAKTWIAQIKVNNVYKYLGLFDTKEEAYEAYKKASEELHGDFRYTP